MIDEKILKKVEGGVNPCCGNPENIDVLPTDNPFLVIRKCKVCGCNHYWMLAEPAKFGVRMFK